MILTTALYDIKRNEKGDGRTLEQYLEWFSKTLKLKVNMNIFIEKKFYDFVLKERENINFNTNIQVIEYENLPLVSYNEQIKNMFESETYIKNMQDRSRIECRLSDYLIIIYSKFFFLSETIKKFNNHDYYCWMDAGYSRFFYNNLYDKYPWPNINNSILDKNKITINTILHNGDSITNHVGDSGYWSNHSYIAAGLFLSGKENMNDLCDFMFNFFEKCIKDNKLNNEQIALHYYVSQKPDKFNLCNVIRQKENINLFNLLYKGAENEI